MYAYFFVLAKDVTLSSLFLMALGAFSLKVMIVLYGRLKEVNADIARIAAALGVIGAAGMIIHGGYDLANAINPQGMDTTNLPSQIDPRGLVSFGFTGVAFLKISWLMSASRKYPAGLVWTGALSGVLFIVIYVARLTVLLPTNPVLLYPVLLNGFIINPLWFFWLGAALKRR